MRIQSFTKASIAALTMGCGVAMAAPMDTPESISGPEALFQRTIASELMKMLPVEAQQEIRAAKAVGTEAQLLSGAGVLVLDERYDKIAHWVSPEDYAVIDDVYLDILARIADDHAAGKLRPALCFTPGTPHEVIQAFDIAYKAQQLRYQPTSPWSSTAIDGATGGNGSPINLTYSYVPDGTFVPDLIGGVSGNSQLFAWLNGVYGSPATWQPLFDQVFDRWAQLCNITYTYEPNDDGSNLNTGAGVVGVRGDVRIAAIPIDGNSGILAYNNFPNDGDMVFDAFDSFYNSTGGGSIRFRNVTAHEHGHGIGMLHVCPANATKLMEPFISTAYDGPQIDDIIHGQRKYGDLLEPNDNAGSMRVSRSPVVSSNTSTTASPAAGPAYQQGTQTQACNSGTLTDYDIIHDLQFELIASDGSTVLDSANNNPAGDPEVFVTDIASPGTYYLRLTGDSTNDCQVYTMLIQGSNPPFIGPSINVPAAPTILDPGVATTFDVNVNANQDTIVGTPQMFYRFDGGAYQAVNLASQGGSLYEATIPGASCGDTPEFYIEAVGQTVGSVFDPPQGAAGPYTATVGTEVVAFDDNFESNMGWTVSGTATDGQWQRTTPTQGGDGRISDPADDADGSGQCYITDNGADNSDVDGGNTILTSPVFDLSALPDAVVSYYRWFDNNEGGDASNPFTEIFQVEISDNGGSTWTNLETVGPTGSEVSGGWFFVSYNVADFVNTTANVRVRFIAKDDVGTIVEAGVDGFNIGATSCEDPATCFADCDGNGSLNVDDIDCFVAAFLSSDLGGADCDGNGTLNVDDIDCFVAEFLAGCP